MSVGPLSLAARVFQTELRSLTNPLKKSLRPVSVAVQNITNDSDAVKFLSTPRIPLSIANDTGLSKKSAGLLSTNSTRSFWHGAEGSTFSEQAFRANHQEAQKEEHWTLETKHKLPEPDELKHIINTEKVTHLDLSNVWFGQLTDAHLRALGQCPGLISLILPHESPGGHKITSEGLKHLSSLTNLKELNFSGLDAVNDDVLKTLTELKQLERLDLSNCKKITNQGLAVLLPQLKNLTYLGMCGLLGETTHHETVVTDECLQHLVNKEGTKVSTYIPYNQK